jgi:hypothetical protein
MDPTEGSETLANINQTLGIHPKVETVNTEYSESLKSRIRKLVIPSGTWKQNAVIAVMQQFMACAE